MKQLTILWCLDMGNSPTQVKVYFFETAMQRTQLAKWLRECDNVICMYFSDVTGVIG